MSVALQADEFVPDDASFDSAIRNFEAALAKTAEHEAVLWGSPQRKGIVPTIDTLADTVARLADSVTKLTQRVTGEDGITTDIRDMKKKFDEAEKSRNAQREASEKRVDRLVLISIFVLSPLYAGLLWVLAQYVTAHGGLR